MTSNNAKQIKPIKPNNEILLVKLVPIDFDSIELLAYR